MLLLRPGPLDATLKLSRELVTMDAETHAKTQAGQVGMLLLCAKIAIPHEDQSPATGCSGGGVDETKGARRYAH